MTESVNRTPSRRGFIAMAGAAGLIIHGNEAASQAPFPSKVVKLVVPIAAGGALDLIARLLADRLRPIFGQQVIVENRAGAGGNLGAQTVATSEKDGHVALIASVNTLAANKWLYGQNMSIDPMRDLAPVSRVATGTLLMVVNAQRPWRNFEELVNFAKQNPGQVTMGSSGVGTTSHLFMEWVKRAAGVDIVHVPYRGGALAIQDLLSGSIDMMFDVMPAILPFVKDGKFRPIAVGSARRVSSVPELVNVPGMAELLPNSGIDANNWYAVTLPSGTSPQIVSAWHSALTTIVREKEFAERLVPIGFDPVIDSSPEAFEAYWRAEENRWRELVDRSGAKMG